jgi:hypothetical protein
VAIRCYVSLAYTAMPAFSPEVTQALSEDLHDCLLDAGVTEAAAKFLVDKKILKLAAFADLADNKAGIVEVVGRPAGLDPGNMIECQPLKSAWRDAEAKTKASLEAHAKGEDVNKDVTLGSEQRERLDDQLKAHFRVMWPAAWLSTNGLLGKIKRFYDKRTDFVPRIETDVRNILESEPDKFFNVFLSKGGSLQAQATQGSSAIHGLWKIAGAPLPTHAGVLACGLPRVPECGLDWAHGVPPMGHVESSGGTV